jgi:hypothetical protein
LTGLRGIRLLQISEQNLGVEPAVGKDDGLQPAGKDFLGDPCGFIDVAAPDAKVAIDDEWDCRSQSDTTLPKRYTGWTSEFENFASIE